jgi:hypothetical protein
MLRFPRRWACLAAVLSSVAAAACSSGHPAADSGACSALQACCATLTGDDAASCRDTVTGANDSACTSALGTLVQAGSCAGGGFDAGGTGADSGVPCSLTGTCAAEAGAGAEAGADADGGTTPLGPQCQTAGTCADGTAFQACTETGSSGTCNAAIVFPDGTVYPCASCTNCAAASVSAQAHCGTSTTNVDAGPDAGDDCGTAPALHPEAEAGVYCPFTASGSIHCAAGQECCETPSTVANGSTCQPTGAACPVTGSLAWGCDGPVDCAGSSAGSVCCAEGDVSLDAVCGFDRGSGFTGSHCAQGCAAGEVAICSETTDPCAQGTQCTPFKVAGVVLGTCQ